MVVAVMPMVMAVIMPTAGAMHVWLVLALDRDAQRLAAHGRGWRGGGFMGVVVTVVMAVVMPATWAMFVAVIMRMAMRVPGVMSMTVSTMPM